MTGKSQDFIEAYHQANPYVNISEEIVALSLQFETNHSQWLDKPANAENTAAFFAEFLSVQLEITKQKQAKRYGNDAEGLKSAMANHSVEVAKIHDMVSCVEIAKKMAIEYKMHQAAIVAWFYTNERWTGVNIQAKLCKIASPTIWDLILSDPNMF